MFSIWQDNIIGTDFIAIEIGRLQVQWIEVIPTKVHHQTTSSDRQLTKYGD